MIHDRRISRRVLAASLGLGASVWIGSVLADYQLESESMRQTVDPATPSSDLDLSTDDIRSAFARPWQYEDVLLQFNGVIVEMRVAPPGEGYPVGEPNKQILVRSQLLVDAEFEDGNDERILVGYDDDPEDFHQDDRVRVTCQFGGMHEEELVERGGYWHWPFVIATQIEEAAPPDTAG